MALDVAALLRETGALLTGHFRLSSGLHSPNYVQCALLLEHPGNAKAFGEALAEKVRGFEAQSVIAPALGGVIIGYTVAEALDLESRFTERREGQMVLRRGFHLAPGERVLIVEDVVTTGKSTRETADVVQKLGGTVAGFASILNRSGKGNPFAPALYASLLTLGLDTYDQASCRLCKGGVPIDAPGSRFGGEKG